jgi:hypothetical protein
MWDNLTALQPATVKEAQTVFFLRKLPRRIRNLINPWNQRTSSSAATRSGKAQTMEEAAAAAPRPLRGRTLLSEGPAAHPLRSPGKGLSAPKSNRRRLPTPGPSRGGRTDRLCFYHSRLGPNAQKCEKGCSYQEN